jgi:hypothetical protein
MRARLRRVFVAFLAATFAVSGLTWQSCMAKHLTPAPEIVTNHSHDLHDHNAGHSKHHHDHQVDAAPPADTSEQSVADTGEQSIDDHACMKCCSLCIASGIAPSFVAETTIFKISFVEFAFKQAHLFDRAISIDPGIPKRIV